MSFDSEVFIHEQDRWRDLEGGLYAKLNADYFLNQHFGFGLYGTYWMPKSPYYGDIDSFGVGVDLKPRYIFPEAIGKMDFGISLIGSVGYRGSDVPELGFVSGLNLGVGIELALRMNRFSILLEPGFQTQPAGGNDASAVTFGPIFHITAGFAVRF
jgi:hypothetical protein